MIALCTALGTLTSTLFLSMLALGGVTAPGLLLADGAALAVGFGVYQWERRKIPLARPPLLLLAVFGTGLAVFVIFALAQPQGDWDAWVLWIARARFINRAGPDWRLAFEPALNRPHVDYPLMWPLLNVAGWQHLQPFTANVFPEPQIVSIVLSAVFTFGIAYFAYCALRQTNSYGALVCGVVLSISLMYQGKRQHADVILAFCIFAALLLVARHFYSRDPVGVFIAGILAGLAGWTKNEGLMFIAALSAAYIVSVLLVVRDRTLWRGLVWFVLGVLPGLAVTLVFKSNVGQATDLLAGQGADTLAKLTDPSRYLLVGTWMLGGAVSIGSGGLLILMVFWILHRPRGNPMRFLPTKRASVMYITLGFMLAAYVLVYLTTPHDLFWHLAASVDRVMMHIWPVVAFVICRPLYPTA